MNVPVEVTLSSKGQIVIPKDVRDALDLHPGEKLALSHSGRQILIEAPAAPRPRINYAEFRRRVPRYNGPPVAVEDMTVDFEKLWAGRTDRS
jgi:AbrB family looped-hinge helix DNA binding protein